MSFTRRQLRNWAARVLFLWLFGVCVGVANACVTSSAAANAVQDTAASVVPTAADHEHHGAMADHQDAAAASHHVPGVGGDAGGHGASLKSNCSDFCDKASAAIPSLKSALDDLQTLAFHLPAFAVVLTLPAFEPVQQGVPRRDGVRAPPIPIAFLRLAL